ncbi:MAG: tRNA (adenosine(37)-N6)-threonylcarbamoyltransferase complex dimerization subunit type 1 TsaB, partial [Cyanobacteria bacterium J06576_12]
TSSPQLGLMLQGTDPSGAPINRHQVWDLGRDVSGHLHVKMMEFIQPYGWQDLSFVAVAKGPGGFTGTRIGVVAARTLAQQLTIPLFGVSSLAALAAQSVALGIDSHKTSEIAVAMPAKREAVYGAVYRVQANDRLAVVRAEAVVPAVEWESAILRRRGVAIVKPTQEDAIPMRRVETIAGAGIADSVTGVMSIAMADWERGERPEWSSVMPFYGQHPVTR